MMETIGKSLVYYKDGSVKPVTRYQIVDDGLIFYANGDKFGYDARSRTFYKYEYEIEHSITGRQYYNEIATICNHLILKVELQETIG